MASSAGAAALRVYLQELQQLSQDNAIGLIDQLQEQINALRGEFAPEDSGQHSRSSAATATATTASSSLSSSSSSAVPALPEPEDGGGDISDGEATFESLNVDPAWQAPRRNDDTSDEEENPDGNNNDDDDEDEEDEDEDENLVETGYSVIAMTQHEFEDLCALVEEEEEAMAAKATNEDEADRGSDGGVSEDRAGSAEDADLEAVTQQLAAMRVGESVEPGPSGGVDEDGDNEEAALASKASEGQQPDEDGGECGEPEADRSSSSTTTTTTVYDRFALPVIFKAGTTGFEATKDYRPEQGDVIAGRYLVRATLGEAAFSVALRCVDLHPALGHSATSSSSSAAAAAALAASGQPKKRREVCLKVVKNNKDFFDQSLDEIKLLTVLNKHTSGGAGTTHASSRRHILQLYDYFYFREHLILATELLGPNLYEFAKSRRKAGLPNVFADLSKLRFVSQQILDGLACIHEFGVIHCDIKPENILLTDPDGKSLNLKIIDYGSSAYATDKLTLYIQSRSYRAPEVILGIPYDFKIDVWSVGCVVAELFTGRVLLHSNSVQGLLAKAIGTLGDVPERLLRSGRNTSEFFCNKTYVYKEGADSDDDDDDADDDDESDEDRDDHDHEDDDDSDRNLEEDGEEDGQTGDGARRRRGRRRPCVRVFQPVPHNALEQQIPTSDASLVEFLRALLMWDPLERPSSREALSLPFLALPVDQHEQQVFFPRNELMAMLAEEQEASDDGEEIEYDQVADDGEDDAYAAGDDDDENYAYGEEEEEEEEEEGEAYDGEFEEGANGGGV